MLRSFMVLFLFVSPFAVLAQDIVVDGPWVREAPPNAKALAGYALIKNAGSQTQELVGVSSPLFEKVEFHITIFEGGMMRMKHLESLVLKPGESEEFEPGGRHLMLINPRKRLRAGDIVPMTLITKEGKEISFQMQVRR